MKIKHLFQSAVASVATAGWIKPSHWNEDHVVETTADGIVLGRKVGAGAGEIEELPVKVSAVSMMLDALTGIIRLPRGTSVTRPTGADVLPGDMRYNTATARIEVWDGALWQNLALGSLSFMGALEFSFVKDEPDGWMMFAGSFGRLGSATTHPRDDCRNLYNLIWTYGDTSPFKMTDANPRGLSTNVDWTAGRGITFPDWRGHTFALNERMMGLAATGKITGGAAGGFAEESILWDTAGNKIHTLIDSELPKHTHPLPDPLKFAIRQNIGGTGGGTAMWYDPTLNPVLEAAEAAAGDAPHNNVQPTVLLNCFVKL